MDEPTPGQVNENGLQAFDSLGQFLEEDSWYPQRLGERYVYRTSFSGEHAQQVCFAQIHVELEQFVFYAIAPVKAPPGVRAAMAEFITRANYGLRIGNLEMDYEDGEIRYKSSLDFEGQALSRELIKNAIYPAVLTLDRYMPGLLSVMYGSCSAAEAIAHIEKNQGGR